MLPHLAELPALRWKLQNLVKLKQSNRKKFDQQSFVSGVMTAIVNAGEPLRIT